MTMREVMVRRILLAVMVASISFGLFTYFQSPAVSAQANLVCDGLTNPGKIGDDCDTATPNEPAVDSVLEDVLGILSLVAGIIAVIMIIIAAVKFITSQGDAGKVAAARTTIMYAVIGLIVVALAQTIIFFVVDKAINPPPPAPVICTGPSCPR